MAPVATTSANSAITCRTNPRATTISISLASSLGNEIGAKLVFAQCSDVTQYSAIERPAATLVGEDALGRVTPSLVGASWVGQTPVAFLAPPTNIAFAVCERQSAIASVLLKWQINFVVCKIPRGSNIGSVSLFSRTGRAKDKGMNKTLL